MSTGNIVSPTPDPVNPNQDPGIYVPPPDPTVPSSYIPPNVTPLLAGIANNVVVVQPVYTRVEDQGNLIVERTVVFNFQGNGVSVTGQNDTATITINSGNVESGNWSFDGNSIYNINGGSINNSDLSHGATAFVNLPSNGTANSINLLNYYGNITVTSGTSPSGTYGWTFDNTGNLVLPSNTASINYANGQPYGGSGGGGGTPGGSNTQVTFSANATISLSDAGKHYYSTSASNLTMTIANNASAGFAIGTAINLVNQGTGTITVAQGSGVTLYFAGNSTSGNRTLSSYGMATIQKVATDTWFIVGVGVT